MWFSIILLPSFVLFPPSFLKNIILFIGFCFSIININIKNKLEAVRHMGN